MRKPYTTQYLINGKWVGPTGPNLYKEHLNAYIGLHYYVRKRLPKPIDGMCQCCGQNPAIELANQDGQYDGNLDTWKWSCRSCNMLQPLTRVRNRAWTRTQEQRDKIGNAVRGRYISPVTKARLSVAIKAWWNAKKSSTV